MVNGLLTIETFSIEIKSFAVAQEMKKSFGIFELMKKHKYNAGVDTFNSLLDALGRAKIGKEAQTLLDKVYGLLKEMKENRYVTFFLCM